MWRPIFFAAAILVAVTSQPVWSQQQDEASRTPPVVESIMELFNEGDWVIVSAAQDGYQLRVVVADDMQRAERIIERYQTARKAENRGDAAVARAVSEYRALPTDVLRYRFHRIVSASAQVLALEANQEPMFLPRESIRGVVFGTAVPGILLSRRAVRSIPYSTSTLRQSGRPAGGLPAGGRGAVGGRGGVEARFVVQSFSLKFAQADEVMRVIQGNLANEPRLQFAVDAASNSIIVRGEKTLMPKVAAAIEQLDKNPGGR